MHEVTYIDTQEKLAEAAEEWKKTTELGIDTEAENGLHYYGTFLALIQVSSRTKNWVVDVLALKDLTPALDMLSDPGITKIFHDVNFDLRILKAQFNCDVHNVFDTQLAAMFLGSTKLGLDHLEKDYLGVLSSSNFQMADWTRRPLPPEMLEYAVQDTVYLIPITDVLCKQLAEKGRLEWVMEESKAIEKRNWVFEEKTFLDFPGARLMTDQERAVLKELHKLRDHYAKTVNRPFFYIIKNRHLTELVKNPPKSVEEWINLRGVHPIVKRKAEVFHHAVTEGKKKRIPIPKPVRYHYTPKQSNILRVLGEVRDSESERLGLTKHLLATKEQMQDIARTGCMDCLLDWQKKVFEKKVGQMLRA